MINGIDITTGNKDPRAIGSRGQDLTIKPILNKNPYDILPVNGHSVASTQEKWNMFYFWMFPSEALNIWNNMTNVKISGFGTNINVTYNNPNAIKTDKKDFDRKDLAINEKNNKQLTEDKINEFNKTVWFPWGELHPSPDRGVNNPLDGDDVVAIQKFTQITYPDTEVDGWLGTQTLQMHYPLALYPRVNAYSLLLPGQNEKAANINYTPIEHPDPEIFVPILWGDYRFVVKKRDADKYLSENGFSYFNVWDQTNIPFLTDLLPYNPQKHKYWENSNTAGSNLAWDPLGSWYNERQYTGGYNNYPKFTIQNGELKDRKIQLNTWWRHNPSIINWKDSITKTENYYPGRIVTPSASNINIPLTPTQINSNIRQLISEDKTFQNITNITKNVFGNPR